MFIPVSINVGAGGAQKAGYSRILDLSGKFDAVGARSRDMREPLGLIGADLRTQVAAAFATQGATGATGKWTVLSDVYGAWKSKHAPGVPILVGLRPTQAKGTRPQTYAPSGEMRMSMLDPLAMHVGPQRLLYAPTSPYAGYHETGTADMPARPPVDLSLNFLHSIDRTFLVWLNKLMHESGL